MLLEDNFTYFSSLFTWDKDYRFCLLVIFGFFFVLFFKGYPFWKFLTIVGLQAEPFNWDFQKHFLLWVGQLGKKISERCFGVKPG